MKPLVRATVAGILLGAAPCFVGAAWAAPNATVEGVADAGLRAQIELAVGEARTAPASALDARRRAIQASKDAVALLRSEGYYDGLAQPDIALAGTARATIRVTLGRRYRLIGPSIEWIGVRPDEAARKGALAALRLAPGAPGRAADILGAEGRLVARLQKLGYAGAAMKPREVIVDHADFTVKPTFRVAAGARAKLGVARLVGGKKTHARWVASLAPWKPGATYDPALLAKLEKRLMDTGAYEAATVTLAPSSAPAGDMQPVDVTLVDRKTHSLELGGGYSTTEGSGADAKWTLYNRLGLGDSLILTARLYDIEQKLDLEQDLPDWLSPDQTLKIGGGLLGDRTDAYDDLGGGLRIGVVKKFDRTTSVNLGLDFDYVSTQEKEAVNLLATPVGESLNLYIATLKTGFVLDRSNSILNPTRGWRLELETDPTWITGDRDLGYLKTQVQVTDYLPFGEGLPVLATRLKVGSIWGASLVDVPADRRFYAGGGGSVRGYGYQEVGPQLEDGTPVGGVSLTEGSVELRQPVSQRLGVVAFADAGAVGATAGPPSRDLSVGVGLGVRYDLGFGPLRLDLGTPVNPRPGDSPIQVYISIGQAF